MQLTTDLLQTTFICENTFTFRTSFKSHGAEVKLWGWPSARNGTRHRSLGKHHSPINALLIGNTAAVFNAIKHIRGCIHDQLPCCFWIFSFLNILSKCYVELLIRIIVYTQTYLAFQLMLNSVLFFHFELLSICNESWSIYKQTTQRFMKSRYNLMRSRSS